MTKRISEQAATADAQSAILPRREQSMGKRIVAGVFWFLAVGYFWQFGGAMYGFPPALGTILALGVALFMSIDPFGVIWKRAPTRRIARIPEPVAPADGKRVTLPGA